MDSREKNKEYYLSLGEIKGRALFLSSKERDKQEKFTFHKLKRNEQLSSGPLSWQLLFLQRGYGVVRSRTGKELSLSEGQCIMIHLSDTSFCAMVDSFVILWNPEAELYPSDHSFLRSLHPQVLSSSYCFCSFSVQPAVYDFLNLLSDYYRDGKMEMNQLYDLKQRELFLLFRHYYDLHELIQLFYPLIYRMDEFREKILEAQKKIHSSNELRAIFGMKRTSFERKFRHNFGISVHQWILKQKAIEVKKSLADLTLSLDTVRKQHGFNSATHFVRFCRSQLGDTPTQLRQNLTK